jgi:hypothetical protein
LPGGIPDVVAAREIALSRPDTCSAGVPVERIVAAARIGIRGLRNGELRLRHTGLHYAWTTRDRA